MIRIELTTEEAILVHDALQSYVKRQADQRAKLAGTVEERVLAYARSLDNTRLDVANRIARELNR